MNDEPKPLEGEILRPNSLEVRPDHIDDGGRVYEFKSSLEDRMYDGIQRAALMTMAMGIGIGVTPFYAPPERRVSLTGGDNPQPFVPINNRSKYLARPVNPLSTAKKAKKAKKKEARKRQSKARRITAKNR